MKALFIIGVLCGAYLTAGTIDYEVLYARQEDTRLPLTHPLRCAEWVKNCPDWKLPCKKVCLDKREEKK